MRVGESLQLRVLAVDRAGVLCKVVCAEGEEINFFCQIVSYKDRCRSLDHDAELILADLVAFFDELSLALLEESLSFHEFPLGDDHGEHDAHVAECGSTQKGSELFLEEFLPGQADADRSEAQCRVLFLVEVHVVDGLVCADIAGTDDNQLRSQGLNDALVSGELLLFCRLLFAVEVYELGAEQAYAFSIVLVDGAQIGRTADVGINVYACAIEGYAGFALEFLKQSQFF